MALALALFWSPIAGTVALFFALALNPAVEWLHQRGIANLGEATARRSMRPHA